MPAFFPFYNVVSASWIYKYLTEFYLTHSNPKADHSSASHTVHSWFISSLAKLIYHLYYDWVYVTFQYLESLIFLPKLISFLNLFQTFHYHLLFKDLHLNWFVITFHSTDLSLSSSTISVPDSAEYEEVQLQGSEPSVTGMDTQPFWQASPSPFSCVVYRPHTSADKLIWIMKNPVATQQLQRLARRFCLSMLLTSAPGRKASFFSAGKAEVMFLLMWSRNF